MHKIFEGELLIRFWSTFPLQIIFRKLLLSKRSEQKSQMVLGATAINRLNQIHGMNVFCEQVLLKN